MALGALPLAVVKPFSPGNIISNLRALGLPKLENPGSNMTYLIVIQTCCYHLCPGNPLPDHVDQRFFIGGTREPGYSQPGATPSIPFRAVTTGAVDEIEMLALRKIIS
jgi:hypothetical protein